MKKLLCLALALLLVMTGCSTSTPSTDDGGLYKEGTYTATADGNNGPVTVEVKFSSEKIESVTVTEHAETAGLADPALERIPAAIVAHQSLGVDAVSGATNTSNAILNAVADAVTQAGGDAEALKNVKVEESNEKAEVTKETEVVVVGSGIAGLSAAIAAAEDGAKVVVIEKMATTGGTTAISGGYLICVDSELHDGKRDDSLESFMKYWDTRMAVSGVESGYPDKDRAELVFGQTGATVDWLTGHGLTWNPDLYEMALFGDYTFAVNTAGGRGLVDQMIAACEKLGVEIITECKGEELIVENGVVTGIIAETANEVITYKTKAVVLATGGISQTAELVEKYSPKVAAANTISVAAAGATGDGLLMALEAGAVPFDSFFTSLCYHTIDPAFIAVNADAATIAPDAQLGVDANGVRFGSESGEFRDSVPSAMVQNATGTYWYIFDSADEAKNTIFETGVTAGVVAKGETIEELAAAMGVDSATLKATYDSYMSAVAAGVDEEFGKAAAMLLPIEKAPYYAVKFYPTTFGSQGGVLTDEGGRCLNANNEIIKGLYAAGADSNRYFYNENYVLAASLGIYATTGKMTGEAVAADIK